MQESEITPLLAEDLNGLEDRFSYTGDALSNKEILLYLHNLQADLENKNITLRQFQLKLKQENLDLNQHLELAKHEHRQKLENILKANQRLAEALMNLQNQIANTESYVEWLWMQYVLLYCRLQDVLEEELKERCKKPKLSPELGEPLEVEAQKARRYPYFSPLRYTPLPTTPFS